jgi:LuxR family maltose regulon positive regulatory protein
LELCQELTESDHCRETLDHLICGNINVSRVGTEYRYHNLFLEYLREKLNQSSLDIKALNKITASYYLRQGNFLSAKNYAMKSGDPSLISLALRSFYELKTFSLDEYVEFHTQYKLYDLPDAVCEKMPLLYPARIFFLFANGNICETGRLFDKLYQNLPVISREFPDSLENIRSMLVLDCRYKLSELSSLAAGFPSETLDHTNLQAPTFSFQLPFYHRSARDYYQLTDPEIADYVRMFSVNILKQNLSLMFDGVQAGLLMEKNHLSEALEIMLTLKKSINPSMSPEFIFSAYLMTAQLYLFMNQRDKCDETLTNVKKYITASSCQYLLKNLSAFETSIALLDGNKNVAKKWLENYYINDDSFTQFYKLYRNFITVRAYIVLSQTDKAYSALSKLKALSASYDRPVDEAEAEVLLSVTDWISGNKKEARIRLLEVLSAMQPFGFIRVIANEGKAVLPILSAVIKKMEKDSGTSEELLQFTMDVYFTACEQSKKFKGLTHNAEPMAVKLSPKQKMVLELLAQGRKNAEIIKITGLSLNTVRTHTRVIYQKLEVNNATDAVVKARQLGILK